MPKLRILIVDDEPLARERLRALLTHEPDVDLVGESDSGTDALKQIAGLHPDIVFLDVQMPGCNGLEVAERLPPGEQPAIVFVTAFEQFAVEAFAARAIDYLLKPFGRERLQQALQRAADQVRSRRTHDLGSRVESLLSSAKPREPDRFAVRTDGRVVFLKPDEIVWVEAANNYCVLHLADTKRLMLRESLSGLEARLGTNRFARVNRSAMVHVDHVRELQPSSYGDYVVVLRNGVRLPLSRALRGRLQRFASDII